MQAFFKSDQYKRDNLGYSKILDCDLIIWIMISLTKRYLIALIIDQ